jgi:hypothetical protein
MIEAAKFYEQRVPTLGSQWLAAVEAAVARVLAEPFRWRILERDIRICSMPRFPYSIYFRVVNEEVRILAFKHHKRHPDYWRYRDLR